MSCIECPVFVSVPLIGRCGLAVGGILVEGKKIFVLEQVTLSVDSWLSYMLKSRCQPWPNVFHIWEEKL